MAGARLFTVSWWVTLLAGLLLFTASAQAAPIKNMTYEQFEKLVRQSAMKIPELKLLWFGQVESQDPVYLGGGILRGLLKWVEKQSRNHTPEQIRNMRVPGVNDLISQKDADLDLYHDTLSTQDFRAMNPAHRNWDILDRKFYKASLSAGGPTIEKIRVNPLKIDDPLGGLRDFYEGRLRFSSTPAAEFLKFRGESGDVIWDNYKSALVMRTLRFQRDLPSLEIRPEDLEILRAAVREDAPYFKAEKYWLQKALYKLYQSTGKSSEKTIALLDSVGLTEPLAKFAYSFDKPNTPMAKRDYLFLNLPPDRLDMAAFDTFKKQALPEDVRIEAMKKMARVTKDPQAVEHIFTPTNLDDPEAVSNAKKTYNNVLAQTILDTKKAANRVCENFYSLIPQRGTRATSDASRRLGYLQVGIAAPIGIGLLGYLAYDSMTSCSNYAESIKKLMNATWDSAACATALTGRCVQAEAATLNNFCGSATTYGKIAAVIFFNKEGAISDKDLAAITKVQSQADLDALTVSSGLNK